MAVTTAPAPTMPNLVDPAPEAAPAPAGAPGPLSRILAPVEPARPVQPLGSTAAMGQTAEAGVAGKSGKDSPAKAADRNSVVGALVRALAARLGRTGTTTKRTHQVTETRVSGATSTSTAKQDGRTSRDAKLADLSSKTSQRPGRDSASSPSTQAADTKGPGRQAAPEPRDRRPGKGPAEGSIRPAKDGAPAKAPGATKDRGAEPSAPPQAKADPKGLKGLNSKTRTAPKGTSTTDDPKKTKTTAPERTPIPDRPKPEGLRTQPAREAGYRDGTRVATVAGKVEAYRDGARDGWDDQRAADHVEAKQMDETRTRNALKGGKAPGPAMEPATGSTSDLAKEQTGGAPQPEAKKAAPVKEPAQESEPSAPTADLKKQPTRRKEPKVTPPERPAAGPDTAPAAVPVRVNVVGANDVSFIADGVQHIASRREIRTLCHFERRLATDGARLGRIEEQAKDTRAHAQLIATKAQRLFEQAQEVKGGLGLARVLMRLAERARVLHLKADEVQAIASRSTEAVRVLAANANTRHGVIYRAVVDSPLTKPAERTFYQDGQGG